MSTIISHRGDHHLVTEPSTSNVTAIYEIECQRHILTTFVIPDILLFLSFAYGLYIFRWKQTEQLSTLTETVGHSPSFYWERDVHVQLAVLT